jgi:transcriptional regulator with XRE-family HTH domain
MDIRDVRHQRLRLLLSEKGAQQALAERMGVGPAYVNQLYLGNRNIGERAARKIERALSLPDGYMDGREDALTAAEKTHLDLYRRASVPVRELVDAALRSAVSAGSQEPTDRPTDRPTEQEPGLSARS